MRFYQAYRKNLFKEVNSMIHIKCKKCGWWLPFSGKRDKDTVSERGDDNSICPSCGEILIKRGGKVNRWK
jgi:predicted RNA-binding Zn-ribbon protein involved in translation (DUF1610 family)